LKSITRQQYSELLIVSMPHSPLHDATKPSVQVVLQAVHWTEQVWSWEWSSKVEPRSDQTQTYRHHRQRGICPCTEETMNVLHTWCSVACRQLHSTRDDV